MYRSSCKYRPSAGLALWTGHRCRCSTIRSGIGTRTIAVAFCLMFQSLIEEMDAVAAAERRDASALRSEAVGP